MLVRSIKLRNFMVHDETDVVLPERGLVLVVGSNGSGKSSMLEAVSYGIWGKTLRSHDPWRESVVGSVVVDVDGVSVRRGVTKSGSKRVEYSTQGGAWQSAASATKTQEAVVGYLGEWDTWRRTHVFSSSDASHFSMADDADRKRLIEGVLGLHVFDEAAQLASEAARVATLRLEEARRARENAGGALTALLEVYIPSAPEEPVAPTLAPEPDRCDESALAGLRSEYADVTRAWSTLDRSPHPAVAQSVVEEQWAAKRAVADALARLAKVRAGRCSECQREYGDGDVQAAQDQVASGEAALLQADALLAQEQLAVSTAKAERAKQLAALSARGGELTRAIKVIEGESHAWRLWKAQVDAAAKGYEQQLASYRRAKEQHAIAEARRREHTQTVKAALANAEEAVKDAERAVRISGLEQRVLGLRGVRAMVLGRALGSIEVMANLWLSRLAPGVEVRVQATTEKKAGGQSDKIALLVSGAGGQSGYRGASGGERRRIDAAILLALSEVASGASGRQHGTLFFDELFDAIDAEGVHLVAATLATLAETRPVVVISHSQELMEHVRADVRIEAKSGCFSVV